MKLAEYTEEIVLSLLAGLALFSTEFISTHVLVDSAVKGLGAFAAALAISIRARNKEVP